MASPILQLKPERKSSAPVKRRVSRACDHCHRMRTRCNGQVPCSRCVELEYVCQYNREKKRRGKVPRHIQKQREVAASQSHPNNTEANPNNNNNPNLSLHMPQHFPSNGSLPELEDDMWSPAVSTPLAQPFNGHAHHVSLSHPEWPTLATAAPHFAQPAAPMMIDPLLLGGKDGYAPPTSHHVVHRPQDLLFPMHEIHMVPDASTPISLHPEYAAMRYSMHYTAPAPAPAPRQPSPHSYGSVDTGSPQSAISTSSAQARLASCRYPVLKPLLPYLGSIISVPMACDLLEYYFQSASAVFLEPLSPYILASVFRRHSFLRQHNPRKCSPALLASLLWVSAQTCEASFLASSPLARASFCQKLWKLTVDLLKPLVHSSSSSSSSPSSCSSLGLPQGNGNLISPAAHDTPGVDRALGPFHTKMAGAAAAPASSLDDVATYMNLGTVTSASEYKAASLRWWNAAWSLARELRLGRELPQETTANHAHRGLGLAGDALYSELAHNGTHMLADTPASAMREEVREERRRLWWLLYMVDRHLALSYNKPLAMLDNECDDLYQPVPDTLWQAGEFFTGNSGPKRKGLSFACTSHDVFGFFLPLMTVLGDIVDLNMQKNHPRFGQRTDWEAYETEIVRQLDRFSYSVQQFKAQHAYPVPQAEDSPHNGTPDPIRNELNHQTRKVAAYATHISHVMHILLHGKWDPVALLDDSGAWNGSQSFLSATSRAISAAQAVEEILELDPDLSFMPYFFGTYLLQGSLILLLADKLSTETDDSLIRACETIVRAHEAAVVTLNTEYQTNFRKVMISTLAQIKGHTHSREMTSAKRRDVLSLYRWTTVGNGLAT